MTKTVDYIIVGCGLAGIAFCEMLRVNNKSFVVFDNASQQSSVVAGGLYNPVVLKRFTSVWRSKEQLQLALPFYKNLESLLNIKLDYKLAVLRRFTSLEEQNNWFVAADKPKLSEYLSLDIIPNSNAAVNATFGFGKVKQSGRIDTSALVKAYKTYLKTTNSFCNAQFEHEDVKLHSKFVSYNNIEAKQIVFAEGFGLKNNPFFNYLPLNGTKGELLTIEAPKLKLESCIKSGVFIIPLGNNLYRVGATYEWTDKTNATTILAKQELLSKLKVIINCEFKVVKQVAGIRPTVIDRRPLVGAHHTHKFLYVLNGLGTRGVIIAPYVAQHLFNYIENNTPLDAEIDSSRFTIN